MDLGFPLIEDFENLREKSLDLINGWKKLILSQFGINNEDSICFSRLLEYTFGVGEIKDFIKGKENLTLLDIGSSFTFFPFYLFIQFQEISKIFCLDNDSKVRSIFGSIKDLNKDGKGIYFIQGDACSIGIKEESFDIILNVSVLEHTKNPFLSVYESYRALRKGGLLIASFDVCFPGFTVGNSPALLLMDFIFGCFGQDFPYKGGISFDFSKFISSQYVVKKHPQLLPWKDEYTFRSFSPYMLAFTKT